jgi:hypothetical protein
MDSPGLASGHDQFRPLGGPAARKCRSGQLNKQYRGKGLSLIGVASSPTEGGVNWLKETPVSFPILFDTDNGRGSATRVHTNTVILGRRARCYIHRG